MMRLADPANAYPANPYPAHARPIFRARVWVWRSVKPERAGILRNGQ